MKNNLKNVKAMMKSKITKISNSNLRFITGGTAQQAMGSSGSGSGTQECDGVVVHCCRPPEQK